MSAINNRIERLEKNNKAEYELTIDTATLVKEICRSLPDYAKTPNRTEDAECVNYETADPETVADALLIRE